MITHLEYFTAEQPFKCFLTTQTEVLGIQSLTQPWYEPMTPRSWRVYFMSLRRRCFNHSATRDHCPLKSLHIYHMNDMNVLLTYAPTAEKLPSENMRKCENCRHAMFMLPIFTLYEKAIHQVTTMTTTSKNVLFPGHNHLLTTSTDDPSLAGARVIIKVSCYQHRYG